MHRYADGTYSVDQMRAAVLADVTRAARMADSGLGSFNAAVQPANAKQGLRERRRR